MRDTTRFAQHSQTERLLPIRPVVTDASLAVRGSHPLWTPHSRRLRRVALLGTKGLTYNSAIAFTTTDSGLGCSRFTRRYLGNRCCFLFQRLVICLSSARRSCTPQVGKNNRDFVAVRVNPTRPLGLQGRSPELKPSPPKGPQPVPITRMDDIFKRH